MRCLLAGLAGALALIALVVLLGGASASGTGNYPPPASGDWVISVPTTLSDETVTINGNVRIMASGGLTMTRATVRINSPSPAGAGVIVDGGLALTQSTFDAVNASKPYYIAAHATAGISIDRSTIRGAGVYDGVEDHLGFVVRASILTVTASDLTGNYVALRINGSATAGSISTTRFHLNQYAVQCVDGCDISVNASTFDNNTHGIEVVRATPAIANSWINDSSVWGMHVEATDITLDRVVINFSDSRGLWTYSANVTWTNGSIIGGFEAIAIEQGLLQKVVLRNVLFEPSRVVMLVGGGHLEAYEDVTVKVVRWSNGGPVANAKVSVTDAKGKPVGSGTTATNGKTGAMTIEVLARDHTGETVYTPHTVKVTSGVRTATMTVTINATITLVVVLDDLFPVVTIDSPPPGAYINTTALDVDGRAGDNETGVVKVELSYDGRPWVRAVDTAAWTFSLNLTEGSHTIQVRAADLAGNVASVNRTVVVDTIPPDVTIEKPANGLVTQSPTVLVRGTTEPNATAEINGTSVATINGAFSGTVILHEGKNAIPVTGRDRAGNARTVVVTVFRDTTVDPFSVLPFNGTLTNQSNLTVTGIIEPGSTLLVNGDRVNITKEGNFSHRVRLFEGQNRLTYLAKDKVGNSRTIVIVYFGDFISPRLTIDSPGPDYVTRFLNIRMSGHTDANATVSVNGFPAKQFGENWTLTVTLVDGNNSFLVLAKDRAGNRVQLLANMTLDRVKPELNLTAPADGLRTKDSRVRFKGSTDPDSMILINGAKVPMGRDGSFSIPRSLAFGRNSFEVLARDRAGNENSTRLTVTRSLPPPRNVEWAGPAASLILLAVLIVVPLLVLNRVGDLEKTKRSVRRRLGLPEVPAELPPADAASAVALETSPPSPPISPGSGPAPSPSPSPEPIPSTADPVPAATSEAYTPTLDLESLGPLPPDGPELILADGATKTDVAKESP